MEPLYLKDLERARYDYSAFSPAVKETFGLSLREADLALCTS